MCQLSKADAEVFYASHNGKPFFHNLTSFMSSAPIVALELMAANCILKWRQLLGRWLCRWHAGTPSTSSILLSAAVLVSDTALHVSGTMT